MKQILIEIDDEAFESFMGMLRLCPAVKVVGTNSFANPYTMIEIIDGLEAFMKRKGYRTISEMRGIANL